MAALLLLGMFPAGLGLIGYGFFSMGNTIVGWIFSLAALALVLVPLLIMLVSYILHIIN